MKNSKTNTNTDTTEEYDFTLTDTEKLCFSCTMNDCKENSKKCLINIAKKNGIEFAKQTLVAA